MHGDIIYQIYGMHDGRTLQKKALKFLPKNNLDLYVTYRQTPQKNLR